MYHILWIDDEWESQASFIKNCKLKYEMELIPFKTQKAGLDDYAARPDFYEAIILDAMILDESTSENPDISNLIKACGRIKDQFKNVPYFISTGQPTVKKDATFKKFFKQLYEKKVDDKKLCEDIITAIKDKPNRIIINQHPELFEWLKDKEIYSDVLDILKISEESNNPDIFNKGRKVLDWTMKYLQECGILNIDFTGTNLAKCVKYLSNDGFQQSDPPIVPLYIARSLYSTTSVCNAGSHRSKVVDEPIRNGIAPYLTKSTTYELLNILYWLTTHPKTPEGRELLRDFVKSSYKEKV